MHRVSRQDAPTCSLALILGAWRTRLACGGGLPGQHGAVDPPAPCDERLPTLWAGQRHTIVKFRGEGSGTVHILNNSSAPGLLEAGALVAYDCVSSRVRRPLLSEAAVGSRRPTAAVLRPAHEAARPHQGTGPPWRRVGTWARRPGRRPLLA